MYLILLHGRRPTVGVHRKVKCSCFFFPALKTFSISCGRESAAASNCCLPSRRCLIELMQCCVFIAHKHLHRMFQAEEEKASGWVSAAAQRPQQAAKCACWARRTEQNAGVWACGGGFASVELLWQRWFAHHSLELEVTGRRGHFCSSTLLGPEGLGTHIRSFVLKRWTMQL